jgi:hypothetical protein
MVGATAIDSDRPIRIVDVPGRVASNSPSKTRANALVAALAGTTHGRVCSD